MVAEILYNSLVSVSSRSRTAQESLDGFSSTVKGGRPVNLQGHISSGQGLEQVLCSRHIRYLARA